MNMKKINKHKDTYIIIPVFNEAKVVENVLKKIKKKFSNIVCIDDGSTDNTFKILSSKKIFLLRHKINLGQGAALQTGIDFAKLRGAKYYITFDSDGQHNTQDALEMLQLIKNKNFDIILGSRFIKNNFNKKIPFLRKIILIMAIKISNLFTNLKLTDTHNGLRVFNKKFANKLNIKLDGMSHPTDIMENIVKNNFKYIEYSTNIIYSKYSISKGQANINSLNILFDMIMRVFKL